MNPPWSSRLLPLLFLPLLAQAAPPEPDADAPWWDPAVVWEENGEIRPQSRSLLQDDEFLKRQPASRLRTVAGQLMDEQLRTGSYTKREDSDASSHVIFYWAVVDPEGVMDFIGSMKGDSFRYSAILSAAHAMAQTDPAGALEKTARFRDPQTREYFRIKLARALTQTDRELWMKWVQAEPILGEDSSTPYLDNWLVEEPARFIRLPQRIQEVVLNGFASQWARQDRDAAFAWARTLEPAAWRTRMLKAMGDQPNGNRPLKPEAQVVQEAARQRIRQDWKGGVSPETALDELGPVDRKMAIQGLLTSDEPLDPRLRILLTGLVAPEYRTEKSNRRLVADLAVTDPAAAFKHLAALRTTTGLQISYQRVFLDWVKKDANAAFHHFREVPRSYRMVVLSAMAPGARSPEAILEWARAQGEGAVTLVPAAMSVHPWPDGEVKAREFALLPGRNDPELAPLMTDAASAIACGWILREPLKATEWVVALEDEKLREQVLLRMVNAQDDPGAIDRWLAACPEGASRDAVVAAHALWLADEDPAAALKLAAAIPDGERRRKALFRLLDGSTNPRVDWRRTVGNSGLPPEFRQSLLDHLR
ncbi:hypothetical protein [Luteolibacter sp. LG18]|uniref:hypothetical protein n=1 Tax=Luteolibacter sp. LG18 TaxID=2819286 RepID=UPI0030C6C2BB